MQNASSNENVDSKENSNMVYSYFFTINWAEVFSPENMAVTSLAIEIAEFKAQKLQELQQLEQEKLSYLQELEENKLQELEIRMKEKIAILEYEYYWRTRDAATAENEVRMKVDLANLIQEYQNKNKTIISIVIFLALSSFSYWLNNMGGISVITSLLFTREENVASQGNIQPVQSPIRVAIQKSIHWVSGFIKHQRAKIGFLMFIIAAGKTFQVIFHHLKLKHLAKVARIAAEEAKKKVLDEQLRRKRAIYTTAGVFIGYIGVCGGIGLLVFATPWSSCPCAALIALLL